MITDDKVRDEKLHHEIKREEAKLSEYQMTVICKN